MAVTEQAGGALPPVRPAWGDVKFTFGTKEAVESHLATLQVGSTAATATTSAGPPRLQRVGLSNATETRGRPAATKPLDNEGTQVAETIIANVDIDHGGVPPRFGRVRRDISLSAPREQTTARVDNEKVQETAVIDANVDRSSAPPKLQRAWGNVPPAAPGLAARDQASVRVNKDQAAQVVDANANAGIADSGFPPKFRRASGHIDSPTSSRATPNEEDSSLPAKLRRGYTLPPARTNLGPTTGGSTSARVGREDGEAPQARPLAARAEPAMVPIAEYQRYIMGILQAHGVLPEEPSEELLRYVVDILRAHGFLPEAPAPAPVAAAADSKDVDADSDKEEDKGVEQWRVFDEEKVSWKELCRLVKPARRVAKKIPVQRKLRSAAKGKKTAGPTDAGKATEPKSKSNKNISEAIKVAVRAAKKVAEAKTISTRRRKVAVKTTVRAKKVVRAKAAGRKASTRGRGAAKAAVTGNTRSVKLTVGPQKRTSEVNLTAGERPPLSASAIHNTPSKSSAPKADEGSESISARPRLTIKLPAMKPAGQNDDATDTGPKENPSAAVTEGAKEADSKTPRRSSRNAEKSEVPKAKEVKAKPAAGHPKRKELHEDGREERDRNKRAKNNNDAKPAEEPKPKIMIRIPKRLTREEIVDVKAEVAEGKPETVPETIVNDSKLRRSARSKQPSFKTRQK
ncbi:hypothetical protein PLEOSDRAFT_158968 [Pleurotus ostreatus PC15]|uniref:Uncharacterized protein n=1 Tax=Pleurotus ostreatus (strain PC15) TaxID=1137138 RepID=A0A067NGE2_PLEO1|nr:hypothetical protein PLEOSDRAFT_158968 [Pleurotus ostreatus PC15]